MKVSSIAAGTDITIKKPYIKFEYSDLTGLMAASRIRFEGLMQLMQETVTNGTTKHLTVLDEEPIHKLIGEAQIETLLQNFDDDLTDGKSITYEGLVAAITNPNSITRGDYSLASATSPVDITAKIIFDKVDAKLSSHALVSIVASILFNNPREFFQKVAMMPVEVTLETEDVDGPSGDVYDPRVVVWGLNSSAIQ